MIELCQLMSRLKSGIWPILGLQLAILATFFKISTSNLLMENIYCSQSYYAYFRRRLVMDTLEKTRIEIWPFMWLFGG